MIISAIVAVANDYTIGKDNDIPWYLPADLKYFKKVTLGHHIIMGRKCYQSIGRPLPKRTNIIITRNPYFIASNCIVKYSLEDALQLAQDNGEEEVFIIGGAQIYELGMVYLDRLYLTTVDIDLKGDVFFPEPDWKEWDMVFEDPHKADDKNPHDYCFKIFERKTEESKIWEE